MITDLTKRIADLVKGKVKIKIGELAVNEVDAISINALPGYQPTMYFGIPDMLYYPLMQFKFRFNNYKVAEENARKLIDVMKDFNNAVPVGSLLYLGKTKENVHEFQLTYKIIEKE